MVNFIPVTHSPVMKTAPQSTTKPVEKSHQPTDQAPRADRRMRRDRRQQRRGGLPLDNRSGSDRRKRIDYTV